MRTQKGSLLLQHGSWHVRFYQDGKRQSKRLCPEGMEPKKIRQLAATLMLEVNSGKGSGKAPSKEPSCRTTQI